MGMVLFAAQACSFGKPFMTTSLGWFIKYLPGIKRGVTRPLPEIAMTVCSSQSAWILMVSGVQIQDAEELTVLQPYSIALLYHYY
jgi:hypothetical protein